MSSLADIDDETHVKHTINSTSERGISDTMKAEGAVYLQKNILATDCLTASLATRATPIKSKRACTF